jgi:hypothetical protein
MSAGYSEDFTVVYLPHRQWRRIKELAMRSTNETTSGGWQDRLRAWRDRMDDTNRSILLSHTSGGPRRLDDMTFIARAIEQRNIGGWQKHAFDIFAGTHPRFTGLTIKPRPGRR